MTASALLPLKGQHPGQAANQDPSVDTQTQPSDQKSRNWKRLTSSGYAQIVIGLASVLLGILAIVFKSNLYQVGHGIWGGVCFYIVNGLFGIAAGARKKKSLLVTYLILSFIAGLASIGVGVIARYGIDGDDRSRRCPSDDYDRRQSFGFEVNGCSSSKEGRKAINGLIIVTCVAELIAAIVGALFTCVPLCTPCCLWIKKRWNSRTMGYVYVPIAQTTGDESLGAVQYVVMAPLKQSAQQPGNVMYMGQPVAGPNQPPGQVQPTFMMVQVQGMRGLAEASAPVDGSDAVPAAPKVSILPEDHESCKPLIT